MDALAQRVVSRTGSYLERPAVVGWESPFLDVLERDFRGLGCVVDRREHVLAISRREGDRDEILSAHVDRHGLVATGEGEFEYAAWAHREKEYGEEVDFSPAMAAKLQERFMGEPMVAYNGRSGEQLACGRITVSYYDAQRDNLVFQIPGMEDFPAWTPVGFSRPPRFGRNRVTGQLDNAISAAVVYELFRAGFGGRALLTCEEEIGRSWRHALRFLDEVNVRPQELLVLDTSPYPDPVVIEQGRVVLRNRDNNGEFNPQLVSRLRLAAERLGVPYAFKDAWVEVENARLAAMDEPPLSMGNTELGRLVNGTGGEVNGATIQLPTFGYHSNAETTTFLAVSNMMRLLNDVLMLEP